MGTLSQQRPINGGNIFDRSFIDSRGLFTIAEISHQHDKDHGRAGRIEVLGFRRHAAVI